MRPLRDITFEVPDCPVGTPSPFDGTLIAWAIFVVLLVTTGITVATAIVRYRAHERHEATKEAELRSKTEIESSRLKYAKNCATCGATFS